MHIFDTVGLRSLYRGISGAISFISGKKNLVFLSPDEGGSDFIRIVSPLMCNCDLPVANKICIRDIALLDSDKFSRISSNALKYGNISFIVSRNKIDSSSLEALLAIKQRYGCDIIVDMDDDLFGIGIDHPQYVEYQVELDKLRKLLGAADLLVASTPEVALGVQHEGISVPTVVIPNYLDDRIWPLNSNAPHYVDGPIRVLYSGTETHDKDLLLLKPLVSEIRKRVLEQTGRNIEFHVIGGTTLDIPGLIIHKVPSEFRRYDKFVSWLLETGTYHFAVAPLQLNNRLNHAKSNLKFLEYSAMTLPCVYTLIEPYARTVENGVDGFLIEDNSQTQWIESICRLACDDDLRESMGVAAFNKLNNSYLLTDHLDDWARLFQ